MTIMTLIYLMRFLAPSKTYKFTNLIPYYQNIFDEYYSSFDQMYLLKKTG